ncbi:glutathione transferase GstA [Duganella sp. FT80W]|uniref:Glutathione transferase GstA n=1 Tax=Duganella guangzhouensis TaxID=2666084 RepID=A0A6I2L3E9_9BURK|nr:glutathione binding-like protein [Duganella guangzhouensis]MRW90779.1 glutathione transferase GstA [Duganella guangzhouensis]
MKLYYAPHTCSLSPLIVLKELGLPHQLIKVDNQTKRTADDRDFRDINPKGYVAALELNNGEVLTEGPAILQYLADLKPEAGLAPAPASWSRVRLQEMLNFITSEIHAGMAPLFNKELPPTYFQQRLQRRMATLEAALGKHAYLMGAQFTVADAYLYTVVGWFAFFAIDLAQWPAVAAWEKRIAARPSVQAAMQAHV